MFATSGTTEYSAMAAGWQCTSRAQSMPACSARTSAQPATGMSATASTGANTLLIQTGVVASVSLFVLLPISSTFLFVSFVVREGLLGLTGLLSLSGLTGPVVSLVGLIKGLSPGTNAGD